MTDCSCIVYRKTGEMNSEASSASSSPGDIEEITEAPKTKHPLPTSTAHMIGWTLSKQVGQL